MNAKIASKHDNIRNNDVNYGSKSFENNQLYMQNACYQKPNGPGTQFCILPIGTFSRKYGDYFMIGK